MIEDPLSERLLWKEFRAGETIIADVEDDEFVFRAIEGFEPPPVELAGSGPAAGGPAGSGPAE
jgi:ATP-dependent Clp protease ATP-binding subunit ClpC